MEDILRKDEIEAFFVVTTLKWFGNWEQRGWFPHHKSSRKQIFAHISQVKLGITGEILKNLCKDFQRTTMWLPN